MAASEINMKQISDDLKSFLTKQIENNTKKNTEKIIEKMDTIFDELSTRIETIDRQEGRGSRNTSQTKIEQHH